MARTSIVLIGMAGVGKSTIGLRLARALGFDFTDLDAYLQDKEGKTVQSIIDEQGEVALVALEKLRMYEIDLEHRVVSPGGSIVYDPEIMKYLRLSSCLVHLDDSFQNIQARLRNAPTRGIVGLKSKSLKEIYDERRPLYLKYADFTVNIEGKSPEEVVSEILRYGRQTLSFTV